ncbi:MAG: tetratricopeptide repeat protein [Planctomycetes bacterium]|nr:tetratricopeptide repeat protein [Planctomycetota bacterium]
MSTAPAPAVDVDAVLDRARPEYAEVAALRAAALVDPAVRKAVAARLQACPERASGSDAMVKGLCLHALSREEQAAAVLGEAGGGQAARYFRAVALMESGKPSEAADILAELLDKEPAGEHLAACLEALLRAGRAEEAEKLLPKAKDGGALGADARAHYLRGFCADLLGNRAEALELYGKALALDPDHGPANFRMGAVADLAGDEEAALEHYRRAAALRPPSLNALLNLGILHEDRGEFSRAAECYRRVIEAEPANARALMFLKDAEASLHMFYDEDVERKDDRRAAVMRTPITDFELSVRSRNCLAKMGVQSLGDLVRFTEQELLSHKNFGETSLQEIKDILAQKALRLGMGRENEDAATRAFMGIEKPQDDREAMLKRPISELELSVRSRNCMATLGVQTIGDLVLHSENDLMGCKNFGQTSMNEIRQKLAEFGLMLRTEEI